MTGTGSAAEEFWEPHYAASTPGTGGPNPALVDMVASLPPWSGARPGLRGRRRRAPAGREGVGGAHRRRLGHRPGPGHRPRQRHRGDRPGAHRAARSHRHLPPGEFDLASAQYLLSPVEFDRPPVFARAAAAVRPGGMLLIVDHASVPPWSWADPDTVFRTPRQIPDRIRRDLQQWDTARLENHDRVADGPNGQRATVTDTIIALVRRPATS